MSVCSRSSWPPTTLDAAGLAQGVEFVDENDAGGLGLGLLEHVADAGGAHADEHFDEVGTRQAEERHARLAGNRLGQQRFAGSRRADEQHALGNSAAQHLVFFRGLEELDDFAEFFDRFFDAGHVLERDADVLLGVHLAAAAAEGHRRAGSAQAAHHHEHHQQTQAHQCQHAKVRRPRAGTAFVVELPAMLDQQVGQAFVAKCQIGAKRHHLTFVVDLASDLAGDLEYSQGAALSGRYSERLHRFPEP